MNHYLSDDARWPAGDGLDEKDKLEDEREDGLGWNPSAAESARLFELLGAYLDGEASAEERREVQSLLDTDPEVKKLYNRMIRCQAAVQYTVPPPTVPADFLAEKVFAKVDSQRYRRRGILGGAILATLLIGAGIHSLGSRQESILKMADSVGDKHGENLTIALNQPIVEIPGIHIERTEKH